MNIRSKVRAKVGMVFQKPTTFPMSIHDNIAFGVSLHEGLGKRDMDERVEWALQRACVHYADTTMDCRNRD